LKQPDFFKPGDPKPKANAAMSVIMEPTTFTEAMESPYSKQWRLAMEEELDSHAQNGTWILVPPPANGRVLDCRWVFKVKYNTDTSVQRFKARLVVKGYRQRHGIDYDETFSSVCRHESIRLLLALAAQYGFYKRQFDVITAFLHGILEELIYMTQPEGFEIGDFVCKLLKSIYGLKQAPRCWNATISAFLKKYALRPLSCDSCVFVGSCDGHLVILILYVDDGLIMSPAESAVMKLLDTIKATFGIKVDRPSTFVGFEIQDEGSRGLFVTQQAYIEMALAKFNMTDCKPVAVPLQPGLDLEPAVAPDTKLPYQQLIGTLIFASNLTRPDIAFAVSKLARFMNTYDMAHWEVGKKLLRYLQGTKSFGLRYNSVNDPELSGYTDSDYAGDHLDRKSTGGFLFFYGNSLISWSSQKQPVVALSSTEAEYVALHSGAREAVWLRRFLKELGYEQKGPTPIYVDNQSAIKLAKNPEFHKRTKHIEVKFHYTRELVEEGAIELCYLPTAEQRADIMTKPLLKTKHNEMLKGLGLEARDTSEATVDPGDPPRGPRKRVLSMSVLTSLAILLLFATSASATTTQHGQPVLWRPSDVPVMSGHYEVHLIVKFGNPCELLTNGTLHVDVLPWAKKKCEEIYQDLFLSEIQTMCGRRDVIELNHNLRRRKRESAIRRRRRRFIVMAFIGIMVVTTLVTAGIASSALGVAVHNSGKIGRLSDRLDAAEKNFGKIDERIRHLNRTIQVVRNGVIRMAEDYIEHKEDYTEFKLKSADTTFAISYITGRLLIGNQLIKEGRRQWVNHRVYAPLLDYFNFTLPCGDDCPLSYAKPRRCKMSDDSSMLTMTFIVPLINSTMCVVEADPFNLMHQTKNDTCSIKYVGPESAIVSTNGTCIYSLHNRPVKTDMIIAPSTAGSVCRPPSAMGTTKYFKVDKCNPKHPSDLWDYVQVKAYHGQYYVYCPGQNISVAGAPMPCPNTTFLLPITSSFEIGQFKIHGNEVEFNHREVPDPLFSLHTNWNLQPNVNLEDIVKELEAKDNDDVIDDTSDQNTSTDQTWMGVAITLIGVLIIVIVVAVWLIRRSDRQLRKKAPESIHLTVTPTVAAAAKTDEPGVED